MRCSQFMIALATAAAVALSAGAIVNWLHRMVFLPGGCRFWASA